MIKKIFAVMAVMTAVILTGCTKADTGSITVQLKDDRGNTVTVEGTVQTDSSGNTVINATDSAGNEVVLQGDISIDAGGNVNISDVEIQVSEPLVSDSGTKVEVPANVKAEVIPKPQQPVTEASTEAPTQKPTEVPTEAPTQAPTEAPTQKPTQAPTEAPTEAPTQKPTEAPTEAPTQKPTEAPTQKPTEAPTEVPTEEPTLTYDEGIDAFIKYINEYRVMEGHAPLIRSNKLCELAEYRLHQMVEVSRWEHNYVDMVVAATMTECGVRTEQDVKVENGELVPAENGEGYVYLITGMEAISFVGGSGFITERHALGEATTAYNSKGHWAYIGSTAEKYANIKYIGAASNGYGTVVWVDYYSYD